MSLFLPVFRWGQEPLRFHTSAAWWDNCRPRIPSPTQKFAPSWKPFSPFGLKEVVINRFCMQKSFFSATHPSPFLDCFLSTTTCGRKSDRCYPHSSRKISSLKDPRGRVDLFEPWLQRSRVFTSKWATFIYVNVVHRRLIKAPRSYLITTAWGAEWTRNRGCCLRRPRPQNVGVVMLARYRWWLVKALKVILIKFGAWIQSSLVILIAARMIHFCQFFERHWLHKFRGRTLAPPRHRRKTRPTTCLKGSSRCSKSGFISRLRFQTNCELFFWICWADYC